jgi:hypothetical protein
MNIAAIERTGETLTHKVLLLILFFLCLKSKAWPIRQGNFVSVAPVCQALPSWKVGSWWRRRLAGGFSVCATKIKTAGGTPAPQTQH